VGVLADASPPFQSFFLVMSASRCGGEHDRIAVASADGPRVGIVGEDDASGPELIEHACGFIRGGEAGCPMETEQVFTDLLARVAAVGVDRPGGAQCERDGDDLAALADGDQRAAGK
jgi:hypothetical protein